MMHADTFYSVGLFIVWAAPDVFMDYSLIPASPIKLLSEEKEEKRSRGRVKSKAVNNRTGEKKQKRIIWFI